MTKIFSAVFFAVCLIATWYVTHNRPSIAYETHTDMQATMVQVITQYLAKEKPSAKDFSILELKSEILTPNSVRVFFQYQFSEPDINGAFVTVQRSGAAELMKAAAQEANNPERWQMREGKVITKEGLIFEDALRVVPGAEEVFNDVPTQGATSSATSSAVSGATAGTAVTPVEAATPVPTPEPTATATPTPRPKPKPTATPEATPSPAAEAAPAATGTSGQ